MHVHANQFDPNLELNTLYAAERAAARKEAENVRNKLFRFSALLEGDPGLDEGVVVAVGDREQAQQRSQQQAEQQPERGKESTARPSVAQAKASSPMREEGGGGFSAWG